MGEFTGRTALVTGASSGIGADIARQLAKHGANIVLVARRAEKLQALAAELTASGVTATAVPCDLADPAARLALADSQNGIDVLINNAGLGVFGAFADSNWDDVANMLNVNVVALTHLTQLFTKPMAARGWGRVMMVASTAAFQPMPLYAVYAATKSYVLSLSEALNVEYRTSNVKFTALCPGPTASEFFDVAQQKPSIFVKKSLMTSEAVAKTGVDAMLKNKSSVVAGLANAAMAFGTRLAPRSLNAEMSYRFMKP
jgi:short-subunit dehydrogenase